MRVIIELPEAWAPAQMVLTAVKDLGYQVEHWREPATGKTWLELS